MGGPTVAYANALRLNLWLVWNIEALRLIRATSILTAFVLIQRFASAEHYAMIISESLTVPVFLHSLLITTLTLGNVIMSE